MWIWAWVWTWVLTEGEVSEHQEHLDEHMEAPQYLWDTEEEAETEDNAVTYRANVIRIVLDKEEHVTTKIIAVQAKTTVPRKTIEPMYSHRSRHREWPSQSCSDNHTLSGYWEINGMKAHCLLESRSEEVLLSLDFTQAMGTKIQILPGVDTERH